MSESGRRRGFFGVHGSPDEGELHLTCPIQTMRVCFGDTALEMEGRQFDFHLEGLFESVELHFQRHGHVNKQLHKFMLPTKQRRRRRRRRRRGKCSRRRH